VTGLKQLMIESVNTHHTRVDN